MLVRATRLGFYGVSRKREGDVFKLKEDKHFSSLWMEKVDEEEVAPTAKKAKKPVKKAIEVAEGDALEDVI